MTTAGISPRYQCFFSHAHGSGVGKNSQTENSCLTANSFLVKEAKTWQWLQAGRCQSRRKARTLVLLLEDFCSLKTFLKTNNYWWSIKKEQYTACQSILLPSLIFSNEWRSGARLQRGTVIRDEEWLLSHVDCGLLFWSQISSNQSGSSPKG